MNFLTNLNLSQNQIQNALMHPLATEPSGVESQVYYNTSTHLLYVHNGTTWNPVGAPYTLPMASNTVLGGIKIGSGLSIDENGVVTVDPIAISWDDITDKPLSSVSDIDSAVSLKHTQNTDTGTTGSSFAIDSDGTTNGVLLKTSTGELQLRNLTDLAYADLRVKNLYVEGTQTIINSNEVNIGDSQILLNADITAGTQNSDGGIAIKRLMADDTTRKDASLDYNNSTNKWQTTFGDVTGTLVTLPLTNKYSVAVGNAVDTSYTITHNLNTRDIVYAFRTTAGDYEAVMADIEFPTVNTAIVRFAVAPTSDQYTVILIG